MPIQSVSRALLTRRVAATACTLCLVIPAAAGASPAANPTKSKGPYGMMPTGPHSVVKAKGPYGIVPPGPRSAVKATGPYGITPAGPRSAVKANGPYGVTAPTRLPDTAAASVHAVGVSSGDDTNGWRTAAFTEAALLAGLALALVLLLPARRRAARMVT
jgi:hypothetical protein